MQMIGFLVHITRKADEIRMIIVAITLVGISFAISAQYTKVQMDFMISVADGYMVRSIPSVYNQTFSVNGDTNEVTTIMPMNSSMGPVDPFGIREIYPTKQGGEQWYMNMFDPNHDNRTDPQTNLTKNLDGSWKVSSNEVRFEVFTSSGYHHELVTSLNQSQLSTKGFMQLPNDWKNVEMTGYVKFNKGDPSSGFTWYARGGHHTGEVLGR